MLIQSFPLGLKYTIDYDKPTNVTDKKETLDTAAPHTFLAALIKLFFNSSLRSFGFGVGVEQISFGKVSLATAASVKGRVDVIPKIIKTVLNPMNKERFFERDSILLS